MKPFKWSHRVWVILPLLALGVPVAAQTAKPLPANKAAVTSKKSPVRQSITARPAAVSAATWAKIVALRPGQTRADLLQVFQEEGGISTRSQRTYLLRGSKGKGPYVKINATFAPDASLVDWQDANGMPKIAAPPKTPFASERPGDVVLSLSPVYWGYMILD